MVDVDMEVEKKRFLEQRREAYEEEEGGMSTHTRTRARTHMRAYMHLKFRLLLRPARSQFTRFRARDDATVR
jgi:hypothetical protein